MIKVLHIPTNKILILPSYAHLKWLFNIKQDEFFSESGSFNAKTKSLLTLLELILEEFDRYYLLDLNETRDTPDYLLTHLSGIVYFQKHYHISEFEVLYV